ncbi:MAG: phosphoadenylyl-sulfate reductase [Bacteroidales bacterium]|nr:phosphoadenylyl-sulfate reductase [Bacteroidales bacterium]
MIDKADIEKLNRKFNGSPAEDILEFFLQQYKDKVIFSTSLGAEDQVITRMIATIDKDCRIITLDTGRLPQETYDTIHFTNNRYGINIEIFFPANKQVEEMVNERGINLFYESVENRKLCCHIRKIVPLKRAMKGMKLWISGLRRSQSVTRQENQLLEWDEQFQILKLNPLIEWQEEDVWNYIEEHQVPYNKLHDQGYRSIGCAPCTRPVSKFEDVRAGRWWWEQPEHKECGLHIHKK